MRKFAFDALHSFWIVMAALVSVGLVLEPIRVITLLVWTFAVAGAVAGVEALLVRRKGPRAPQPSN